MQTNARSIARAIFIALFSIFALQSLAQTYSFNTTGSASALGDNCWEITPNVATQRGAIWSTSTINLSNPFDFTFHVRQTGAGWGADGVAFVLQNINNTTTIGGFSSGVGYSGITPSFAVEVDLWDNSGAGVTSDIPQDHVAIHINGNNTTTLAPTVSTAALTSGGNVDTGNCNTLRVYWSGSGTNQIRVFFNGILRISTTYDIVNNIFGGSPSVFFGITGSTGGSFSEQIVCFDFANAGNDTTVCGTAGVTPVTLTGAGAGSGSFQWLVPMSEGTFSSTVSATTIFTQAAGTNPADAYLEVTNTYSCVDTAVIAVTIDTIPVANAGTDQDLCNSTGATLGASPLTSGTGLWTALGSGTVTSPGSPTSTVTGMAAPTPPMTTNDFLWEVNSFYGVCPADSDTVSVNVYALPGPANAGLNDTICGPDYNMLGSGGYVGTGTWTVFSGAGSFIDANDENSTVNGLNPGANEFIWTITNGPCPAVDDTVTISSDTPIPAFSLNDTATCLTDITLSGVAPPAGGSAVWTEVAGTGGSIVATAGLTADISGLVAPPGTNQYIWTVNTQYGVCPSAIDTVNVVVLPAPTVDVLTPDTTVCSGHLFTLNVDSTGGNNRATWSPAGDLLSTSVLEPVVNPATIGATEYFIVVTDTTSGCSATDSITITVNQSPTVNVAPDSVFICNADTANLVATPTPGTVSYNWTPAVNISNPSIANPDVYPNVPTTYYATVTDPANGCTATDSAFVDVFIVDFGNTGDTTICLGDSIDLKVNAGDVFLWSSTDATVNGATVDSVRVSPPFTTDYEIFVLANFGGNSCSATDTITVQVNSVTASAAPVSEIINPGQDVQLSSSGTTGSSGYFYSWSPTTALSCTDCPDPVANPETTTTYTVTVTDSAGCSDDAQVLIEVEEFEVPNVFSPNGDGINDILKLNYYGDREYDIYIYDRWGVKVFETEDPEINWNGKLMNTGTECQSGPYYMILYIKNDDTIPEELKNKKFDVMLIR